MKLSCIKSTVLIEKKELFGLSIIENVKLSFHLSICSSCKDYKRQSQLIDAALRQQFVTKLEFTEAEKQEIINKLKSE